MTEKKSKAGAEKVHGVLVPKKLADGRWQVSLGIRWDEGKRRNPRRQFSTKSLAQDFCNQERARRKAHGSITADADGALVAAWIDLEKQLLSANAGSLVEVGKRALRDALAVRKNGTARECLTSCHRAYVAADTPAVYANDILGRGNRFVKWFGDSRSMSEATPDVMTAYFTSIGKAATDRKTVSAWMGWAVDEGWLPANPCTRKKRKGRKEKVTKEAVTMLPESAAQILRAAVEAEEWVVLGFLVISLFGGVRPMEFEKPAPLTEEEAAAFHTSGNKRRIAKELVRWTWDHIKSDALVMPRELGKRGPRVIPVNETLAAWLKFIRKKRGAVTGPILAAGKRGGWRKKWDTFRNTHWVDENGDAIPWDNDQLRHSYGSYSLAKSKDAGAVSLAMGNSPQTLFDHYWNWKTLGDDAEAFFNLMPDNISEKVIALDESKN